MELTEANAAAAIIPTDNAGQEPRRLSETGGGSIRGRFGDRRNFLAKQVTEGLALCRENTVSLVQNGGESIAPAQDAIG